MFFVDQEFKELRLIKDGSDIPFLVEGENSSESDMFFVVFVYPRKREIVLNRVNQRSTNSSKIKFP